MDLVAIERVASLDYLHRVFDCYRDGRVAVPVAADGPPPPGTRFAARIAPVADSGWFAREQAPIRAATPAQIVFSSGTTGDPKAILLSHRALADVTERLIAAMGIDASIREYLAVPPTYSFGLGRARVVAAVGGRLYVPPRGFDVHELATMLAAGEVNALAAVPTILRILIDNPQLIDEQARAALRWLEIGSQPMSAGEKRAVRALFPAARIVQHYGLTEASRTTFLDIAGADDAALESVGRPIGETGVRIDAAGHICIRGPHVADGVIAAGGVVPLADQEGWLRTNDLGRIDEDGALHFLGRADHLMNIGGIKVPAELFEERLAAHGGAGSATVAVTAMPDALRGEIVAVAHLPVAEPAGLAAAVRAVAGTFGLGAADARLVEVQDMPRTETGKVRRGALAEAIGRVGHGAPAVPAAAGEGMTAEERAIATIWAEALGLPAIGRDDTFFDLGGDSLSAINVMLRMERAGVAPELTRLIFEGRSVAEIAAAVGGAQTAAPVSRRAQVSDAISMTRGLMVMVVILGHWLPFVLTRMGTLSQPLLHAAIPFFRLGTPGFAIVYGLGLAFFNLPMVARHPDRLRANIRRSAAIVGGGVAILALLRGWSDAMTGARAVTPSTLFFGVLLAYLMLVLASGAILRFVARRRHQIAAVLVMALSALLLSAVLRGEWRDAATSGWLDLARLMLVAKYGFPEMLGYAGLGMAMGQWIGREREAEDLPATTMLAGLILLLGAAVLTVTLGLQGLWFAGSSAIMMLVAYCGVVLVMFGTSLTVIRRRYMDTPLRLPVRLLILTGTLAFLAYVGHELASSARSILGAMGVPDAAAIGGPVLLFAAVFGIALRRLYRLQYGR